MLSKEEIERRKPLWWALSDLWLVSFELDRTTDNDTIKDVLSTRYSPAEIESVFSDNDNHIVREMISSKFPLSKIELIMSEEVAPVVHTNLHAIYGGEWGSFNPEWLYDEILKNLEKQATNLIYRTWVQSGLGKFAMTKLIQDDWQKIIEIYQIKLAEVRNLDG